MTIQRPCRISILYSPKPSMRKVELDPGRKRHARGWHSSDHGRSDYRYYKISEQDSQLHSTKNVSQDSSRNFIFKDMDAAKAWLSECVAAINKLNNNAESDPINKIRQKSEEIIGNLDLENRRSKDKIDILDKQIRDELTRSSAREQQVASQMEQEFEFRKIIFFVGLPIFAAVILVLIIAPRLYGVPL